MGSQQDQNLSQDDNNVPKKRKRTAKSNYSNTKVKARNLLTNVSYRKFKQNDFNNASFIIDILSFIVQYFTPINLDRKLHSEKDKSMVKFLWDECIPHDFTRCSYKNENYNAISNPKLTYQKANAIVKNFIEEDVNRINLLKYKIEKSFNLIHYIYSTLFPKIYNRINNFGVQTESNFDFAFQVRKVRTKQWTYYSKDYKWVVHTYKTGFGNRYFIKGKRSKRLSKQRSAWALTGLAVLWEVCTWTGSSNCATAKI